MSWLSSLLIAALAGLLGLLIAGLISATCVEWFHLPTREGGDGYFIVFMALLGGVLSFVLGLLLTRALPMVAKASFFPALGMCCGAVLALGGVVLLVAWLRADFAPVIDGRNLEVALEVRCPKGFELPTEVDEYGVYASVRIPGSRGYQPQGKLDLARARQEAGQWIVSAVVPLETSSSNKVMDVRFSKEASFTFRFPLRAHPNKSDLEWSQWVDSAWDAGQPEPPREKKFNLRYRVQLVVAKPVESLVPEALPVDTTFDKLGAETPIRDWFPYTQNGAPEERRSRAMTFIVARPNYVKELTALMLDADDDVAKEALYLVSYLPQPQPALLAGVAASGRDIAARIKKFNSTSVEADPGYEGAASVSVRFSAWMEAVRTLRLKSGGDFTAELGPILELSRVRADSVVMRGDVCRVASYYMKEWAGLAPAAGDPPPQ